MASIRADGNYCHSLVLILILISIKTRSDNVFGPKPPTSPTPQPCSIPGLRSTELDETWLNGLSQLSDEERILTAI